MRGWQSLRPNLLGRVVPILAAWLITLAVPATAAAQTNYFWNAPTGGTGAWDTANPSWSTLTTGPLDYTWSNLDMGIANFGGTGGTVTLDAGGITASGVNFSVSGYMLTGGTLTLAGAGVVDTGAFNATINSVIGGSVGLTKNGTGTLTLGGTSTYAGTTTVSTGVLAVTNGAALGATTAGTTVASGAALQISGAITVAEPVTLNGSGIANDGALRKTGNNTTTLSGAITLGSATRINADAGTLTISGGVSGTGMALTVGGAGATTISGLIATGSGGTIVKDGGGTLTLSNGSNSFAAVNASSVVISITGGTVVQNGESSGSSGAASTSGIIPSVVTPSYVFIDGGTLTSSRAGVGVTFLATNKGITLGSSGGSLGVTDTTSGDLNIYNGVVTGVGGLTKVGPAGSVLAMTGANNYQGPTVVAGGTLRVRTNNNVFPTATALTVNSGAIFDLNGLSQAVGSVTGAGNINLGSGTFTNGSSNASTTFSGQFVQTAGGIGGKVTKQGTGTLTLTGNNVYSGTTTVSAGTLKVGSATALGFGGAVATAAGTTVSTGATLDLNGTTGINEVITLNGTGVGGNGALFNSNTTAAALSNGVSTATVPSTAGASTTVTVSGGGGTGAAATASLGLTSASFTISSGTQTYASTGPPTVVVSGNGVATAVLDASGLVVGVTITTVGSGYTTAPTITFSGGTILSPGTAPTGTGNTANFRIANITITTPGSGDTSAATFTSGSVVFTPQLSSVVLASSSSVGGPGDISIAGVVSGAAAALLTKVGAGTLTLAGANTYAGGTTLNAGGLNINNGGTSATNSAIGTGTFTIAGGTIDNTSSSAVTLATNNAQAWNADFAFGGTNALNLGTGAVTLGGTGTARTVTTNGTAPLSVGGVVGGSLGVTKAGTGTLVLGGANTYTGPTSVSAGTLLVNGNQSAATGAVTVASGATLGGSGTVGGTTSVSGSLAPGSGGNVGTFSAVGNVALATNATLAIKLGTNGANPGVSPGTGDAIAVTGAASTLDLATGSVVKLSRDSSNLFDPSQSAIYNLATVATGGNITLDGAAAPATLGTLVYNSTNPTATGTGPVKIDVTAFTGLSDGVTFVLTQTGTAVVLSFTPVPEPATVGLLAAAGLALGQLLRRRNRRTG
jgi:autotransporter-associated beta strand protein